MPIKLVTEQRRAEILEAEKAQDGDGCCGNCGDKGCGGKGGCCGGGKGGCGK